MLEENAMFLAVGEMLVSSIMDEDDEDTTPIPRPMHTNRHTGHVWVHEVLQGHERRCYNTFRMHLSMFLKLRDILVERELIRDSRYVTTTEQLTMFLYVMGHGVATGAMCEHFQHSSETISLYVNRVVKALALLRFTYIVLPAGTEPIHPRVRHDDRFYPYFKDAIGAIDGTYIPAHVLKERQARYRNRKNVISQNVMGVCGFGLIFHYVGVGFEGAAADMTVLRRAMDVGGFTVPQGKYYLVDSGYGNAAQFLAPYRGERYHLSEYQNRGNAAYRNMRDKFNHRHAQLRNCVERCFGVLKNRFQTLKKGNCYPFRVQVLIVLACCVVHNFIRREHGEDYYFNLRQMDNVDDDDDPPDDPNLVITPPDMQAGENLRTQIATQMWANN